MLFDGYGASDFTELVRRSHELLSSLKGDESADGIFDLARETLEDAGSDRQLLHILMTLLDPSEGASDAEDVADEIDSASEELVRWTHELAAGDLRAPAADVLLEILGNIEKHIDRFEEEWSTEHSFDCAVDPEAAARSFGLETPAASFKVSFEVETLGRPFVLVEGRCLRPRDLSTSAATVLIQKSLLYSEPAQDGAGGAGHDEIKTVKIHQCAQDIGTVLDCVARDHEPLAVALRAIMQARYADADEGLKRAGNSADAAFLRGLLARREADAEVAMRAFDTAVAQPVTLGEELGLLGLGLVLHIDCGDGLLAHCGVNRRSAGLLRLMASMLRSTTDETSQERSPHPRVEPTRSAD